MSIPGLYDLQPKKVRASGQKSAIGVTEDMIRHVAHLARLHLDETELAGLRQDMEQILGFIAAIERVEADDREGVEVAATPLRSDVASSGMDPKTVLARAPAARQDCFAVPRVLPAREDRR